MAVATSSLVAESSRLVHWSVPRDTCLKGGGSFRSITQPPPPKKRSRSPRSLLSLHKPQRPLILQKNKTDNWQVASSSTGSTSATTTASKVQDLKKKLEDSLDKSLTNLTDESLGLISELEALNPTPQPATRKDLWAGPFQLLNSSMNNLLYRGCKVTIGRATFNAFKPNDLLLTMEEVYNDVGISKPDAYNVVIPFTMVHEGVPPLQGLLFNEGSVSPSSNTRLNVEFLASTLMPRDGSVDLGEWTEVFGDLNKMDEKGVCKVNLPPAKGWLEVTYLDEDYRITHGNFGTIVVVKRLAAPAIQCNDHDPV